MDEISIFTLLQRIRSICEETNMPLVPQRVTHCAQPHLKQYQTALEVIRQQFIKARQTQQQYSKLETVLQKQQTQLRKKIGIQQQFKLYTDTLKGQVQQLQNQKLQLLENTKSYIKQLKKTNQTLFSQLQYRTHQKGKSRVKSISSSAQKTQKSKSRHNKSTSFYKPIHDKSIKEIIKTEYIERERSRSDHKKGKKKVKMGVYSTISGQADYRDHSKTFQVINKKDKATASKNKNKHGFSNFTLFNMLSSSNKKAKKQDKLLAKSPGRPTKRKQAGLSGKKGKAINRQKKINRSIFSVISMQPHHSNKKETI